MSDPLGLLTHVPLGLALQLAPIVSRELERSGVVTTEGTIYLDCVAPTYHRKLIELAAQFPDTIWRGDDPRSWVVVGPESDG